MKVIPVGNIVILSNFHWDIRIRPDTLIHGDLVIRNVIKKQKQQKFSQIWLYGISTIVCY